MTIHEMVNFLADKIKEDMLNHPLFPYDTKTPEDKRRFPRHMKDVALRQNVTYIVSPELQYFEMGNASAEQNTPHYHILEDAKIIRNPGKGTKKSLGSQRLIGRKSQRDYGAVTYRETTGGTKLIQEYRQNMTRNYDGRIGAKTQPREFSKRKKVSDINKRNYRYNTHYQYIERILEDIVPKLATMPEINAKVKYGNSSLLDGNLLLGTLNKDYLLETITLEGID